jgi:cytochrome P450
MPSALILLLLPLGLTSAFAIHWYLCFRRNIKIAKASGIPYVVVPVFLLHRFWLLTHPLWLQLARKYLPKEWREPWYDFSVPEFCWKLGYEPFKRLGADTFLTVSGGDFSLWVADADVVTQITTRRNDFPKPTAIYASLDIYGKNVVSTEGAAWRRHRKLASLPFTEKNNQLVWNETLDQALAMLNAWLGKDAKGDRTVERIMDDTMRLSLHVISRAGFGRKLEWPREDGGSNDKSEIYDDSSKIQNKKTEIGEGHSMSYTYAIHCLLENILWTFLVHHWMLKLSPLGVMRRAYAAYVEWGSYMREMVASKKAAIQSGKGMDEMDIMGQLVKGQILPPDEKSSSKDAPLSDPEILGNAFVLILAGHETAANSIHFGILLLALNIGSQRCLQKDLEDHFQGRPTSQWDYDRDLPALFGGMTGAVMNEELRLIAPVVNIPKSTYGVGDQPLTANGKNCTVPANTFINLCSPGIHSNPHWWPHGPPRDSKKPAHLFSNLDNDLEEFKPERWLLDGNGKINGKQAGFSSQESGKPAAGSEDPGPDTVSDTSASLYRPPKGAFIPFSEGFRACLGRRFAQIEIMTALAVIFSQYSVELAVDRYASDEEVQKMSMEERRQVWDKAAEDAKRLIRGSTSMITLQMRQGHVPVRFVRKGEERFDVKT